MINGKRMICAVLSAAMLCSAASAAEQSGCVSVTGKLPNDAGKNVSVQIYAPDKSYKNLENADYSDYLSIIIYQNSDKIGEAGDYSFTAEIGDRASGIYRAFVSVDGDIKVTDLRYRNDKETLTAAKALNSALTEADVEAVLKNNRAALGLWTNIYDNIKLEDAAKKAFESLNNKKLDEENALKAVAFANKVIMCKALDESKVNNILQCTEEIDFSESSISKWYNADFVTNAVGESCTARMSNKNISVSDFDSILAESFVLSVIENPDGYGNIKVLLNTFANDIGITKDEENNVYQGLIGKRLESFEELKSEFNKLKIKTPSQKISGGGGREIKASIGGASIGKAAPNQLPINVFDDLSSVPWAEESIVYLAEKGIINGREKTKFCPMDLITREEFVKLLVEAFEKDAALSSRSFSDVYSEAWYAPFIAKAVSAGIAQGIDENKFGIGQPITRQDMAVMAYNAVKLEKNSDEFRFSDDEAISDYAKSAVYTLYSENIISGMDSVHFAPSEYATRAQAAKILYGLLQN